jgi:hypothetical protein
VIERAAAKATEYAAGSSVLGMSFGVAKSEPLTTVAFAIALPTMIVCRWVVETA